MSLKLKKTKDPEQQRLYASLTALGQSLDALSSEEDLTHDEPEDPVAELGATRTRLRLYAKSERPYSSLSALARKLHRHKSEEDAGGLTAATSLHDVVTTLTAQMTSTSRELRATAPDLRAKASDLRARTRTLEASSDSDNAPTDLNDLRARAHALEDAMQAAEEAAKAVDRATQGIKEKVEAMMAAERCLNSTKELVEHMVLGNTGDIVASLLYLSTIILPIFTQCWHTSRPAALAFSLPLTIFFTLNMRKWFTKGFWSRDSVEEDLAGWPGQLMSALEKDVVKLEWSRDAAGCHACVFGMVAILSLYSDPTSITPTSFLSCGICSALSCVSAKTAYRAQKVLKDERARICDLQEKKGLGVMGMAMAMLERSTKADQNR